MPNARGPHSAGNLKPQNVPSNVGYRDVIGYTRDPKNPGGPVTVYTTRGHFTQHHGEQWNVGWDSYDGWQCKFFGNVLRSGNHSSHTGQQNIAPAQYVANLETIGYNRFVGGRWDLSRREHELHGHLLREFWIRGNGLDDVNRFAHPSRSCFIPVESDRAKQMLWGQLRF